MTLSLHATWVAAVTRANPEIRYLVEINDGTNTHTAISGLCDNFVYPVSLRDVTPVSSELDPITRQTQIGSVTLEFEDLWLRSILVANRLKGKKVSIKLGAKEVSEANFVTTFTGIIEKIIPRAGNPPVIQVQVLDTFSWLKTHKITGVWFSKHPLEVIESILTRAGVPSSLIDSTSFDPSDSAYSTISHLTVSRGGLRGSPQFSEGVNDPTEARELIDQLCELLNGQLIVNESGQVAFSLFDSTAASVADWTTDHILSIEQEEIDANVINRVTVHSAKRPDGQHGNEFQVNYSQNDTDSQSAYSYPGESDRIYEQEFKTEWLNVAHGNVYAGTGAPGTNTIGAADTSLQLCTYQLPAFSGCRQAGPSQPSDATLASGRVAYLQLMGGGAGTYQTEIVKVTAISFNTAYKGDIIYRDPDSTTDTITEPDGYIRCTLTVQRAQFGTTAVSGVKTIAAFDITVPVYMADSRIERFGGGAPVVIVTTNFSEYDKQVGDLVTITYDGYVSYGRDGLTTSTKWEIISKEEDLFGSTPQIRWKLMFAGTAVPTKTHLVRRAANDHIGAQMKDSLKNTDVNRSIVANGLVASKVTGLQAKLTAGTISNGATRTDIESDVTHTVTASKDTYVAVSRLTGAVAFVEVDNDDPEPTAPDDSDYVAKVVSDGTEITSVDTSIRKTTAVSGAKLLESSTGFAQLQRKTDFSKSLVPNHDFGMWSRG